jgi:uncharacterized protein YutE (UPF0331/DUF86 family)
MTPEQFHAKMHVVRDNLEKLGRIPQASYEEFADDFRNVDSALHRLQTAIQALIDLGGYVIARRGLRPPGASREVLAILEAAGALPAGAERRFGALFGFRNRIVHLYDRVDAQIVYRILREDRGDIAALLDLLLAALPPAGAPA